MGKYKHHSQFIKEKDIKTNLYPYVCFDCRKTFKKSFREEPRLCPDCQSEMVLLNPKFSAPKKTDTAQWEKVKFLVEHGFLFHSVYENEWGGTYVPYPKTLSEAKEFVIKYKHWSLNNI